MLVSIITPTRDRVSLLTENMSTVAAQRLPAGWDLEQIVCDDGSAPGAAADAQAMTDRDSRVHLVRHSQSLGVAAARNTALCAAAGDVIIDLDDDDLLPPDSVARRVRHLLDGGSPWSYGNLIVVTADRRIRPGLELIRDEPPADWFRAFYDGQAHAWAGTRTYLRSALEAAGGWNPEYRVAEDFDHWLRLTRYAGDPALCPAYLAYWRSKRRSLGIDALRDGSMNATVALVKAAWAPALLGGTAPVPIPVGMGHPLGLVSTPQTNDKGHIS